MNTRLLAAAIAMLIPLAGFAAQDARTPNPRTSDPTRHASGSASFDALDANKDGRISMPEASVDPKLVEAFSTADKNGDGYLDSSEYANAVSAPPQQ